MRDARVGAEGVDHLLMSRYLVVARGFDDRLSLAVDNAGDGESLLLAIAHDAAEEIDHILVGVVVIVQQDQVIPWLESRSRLRLLPRCRCNHRQLCPVSSACRQVCRWRARRRWMARRLTAQNVAITGS